MKIFDCTTFFDENLMLEIRFNILNKYVDKFIVAEAKFSHSGERKKLNFNINKFKDFKKKIIYLVVENEPSNVKYEIQNNFKVEIKSSMRINSILRIEHQRNSLLDCLNEAKNEDYIFYSDNDEIPNFDSINLEKNRSKIIIFKQQLFYYKFNLACDWVDWYGTKGCKKKNLNSFSWLREVKSKKYPFYRADTFFSKNKYMSVNIVKNGGWHFTQLKKPKDIEAKLLNQEHHDEYKLAKNKLPSVEELIKRKSIIYDFQANSSEYKFSKEFKLKTKSIENLPPFLQENVKRYSEWFDFDK